MKSLPRLLLVLVLPLYLVDQVTKWLVVLNFEAPPPPMCESCGEVFLRGEPSVPDRRCETCGGTEIYPGSNVSGDSWVVAEDFFTLVRVHNQGAAFGMGNGTTWAPAVFFMIALIALGALLHFWRRGAFDTLLLRLAAGLLAAGILGNLTDRVLQGFFLPAYREEGFLARLSQGYVVDFLDFKIGLYGKLVPASGGHWPSFNVADSCICVAAFFLILSTFRAEAESKGSKEQADEA